MQREARAAGNLMARTDAAATTPTPVAAASARTADHTVAEDLSDFMVALSAPLPLVPVVAELSDKINAMDSEFTPSASAVTLLDSDVSEIYTTAAEPL